jgi:nitroreductase
VAKNYVFFGAPVGLFFCLDRKLGPPQWADMGMFMQSVMLLAVERGLDTCPQEAWAQWARTVAEFVGLPDDHMVFAGMALGFADETAPINTLRTRREPIDEFAKLLGF